MINTIPRQPPPFPSGMGPPPSSQSSVRSASGPTRSGTGSTSASLPPFGSGSMPPPSPNVPGSFGPQRPPSMPQYPTNSSPVTSSGPTAYAAASNVVSIPGPGGGGDPNFPPPGMPPVPGQQTVYYPNFPAWNYPNMYNPLNGKSDNVVWVVMMILVVAVAAVTITIAAVASQQSPDVSSHMIVRTAHRTRDLSSGNSYSMDALDDTHLTRLYVCMRSAGIAVPSDPNIDTLGEYKTAARNHYDCGSRSDRGWPRDIGFLRCIQTRFDVSIHQSNVFLKCLDLSEGASVEAIQTPASMLLLGSYNFVTFLLTAMGVITTFLIFTAGGYFTSSEFRNENGHVSAARIWSPLSWVPTILALVWSFAMWVTVMIYAFPPSNMWSDAPLDSNYALPGTIWTGFMCSAVTFGLMVFLTSCVGEWMDDFFLRRSGYHKKFDVGPSDGSSAFVPNNSIFTSQPGNSSTVTMPPNVPPASAALVYSSNGFPPNSSPPYNAHSNGGQAYSSKFPFYTGVAGRFMGGLSFSNLVRRSGYSRMQAQLGTKYNTELYSTATGKSNDASLMASYLGKTFALTWVFADGLLFVGMLNNQNSLLNENVVSMWYYIVLCRGFQLASAFFMDDVLFVNVDPASIDVSSHGSSAGDDGSQNSASLHKSVRLSSQEIAERNREIVAHAGVAVVSSQIASLWCMIIVVYHFANAISVSHNLSIIGVANGIHVLQIFFILLILIIDVLKHVVAFNTVFGNVSQEWYMLIIQCIYGIDWIMRSIFIIAAIFSVPNSLSNANQYLRSIIMLSSG